ncbi:hypothetical protein MLD38_032228 [Melastoma candidum]|uniref:Uncharacterized protein n=1 Tax=Melastoma candidum TaxID=119954 RepID=A0ACB9M4U6_9MYRT|nr:hypothetical protein MLD38_032228 [Melastoma candidum]
MKPPQRSSRQPAKNYCGTDVSPQSPPEFFKVYIPAFHSHQLLLPPDFSRHCVPIPRKAVLREPNGRSWRVGMIQNVRGLFIRSGWPEFVQDNALKHGDCLIFQYDACSVFSVKVFGRNGCRKERREDTVEVKEEAETSPSLTRDSGTEALSGSMEAGSQEGDQTPDSTEGLVRPQHPHHMLNLKKWSFRQPPMPTRFLKLNGIQLKRKLILSNGRGEKWTAGLGTKTRGRLFLSSGWPRFRQDNRMQVNQQYMVEFVIDRPVGSDEVVLRHLPPSIARGALIDQIDAGFAGRYDWVAFRPGRAVRVFRDQGNRVVGAVVVRVGVGGSSVEDSFLRSQKHQIYSRAYINFKRPEDVIEFAEFFDGHVFVNEKGSQFKTIVEYAPSQRVPKLTTKKDGREGTLLKDPEYLEFLEILSKPVENLPSAEIQLERREAERSGAAKETPIITPLMDFVRQKRASKAASRRLVSNKKLSGRAVSSGGSGSSKQGSEKRKNSKAMYVLRDSVRNSGGKDASTITLASRRADQHTSDKSMSSIVVAGADRTEVESGSGEKKILLLKGKEREIYHMASNLSGEQLSAKDLAGPFAVRQNQHHEGSDRIIRGIL